jgi:hypothetical protein
MQHRAPQQEDRGVFARRDHLISTCFGEDIDVP